ncbi:MAG: tetratricopeptide repeat protein [Candidatus Latescibacteria bacterium]|nr:tetratricopeptide repeat protein [Candidatus Latescibacterota bacterium]
MLPSRLVFVCLWLMALRAAPIAAQNLRAQQLFAEGLDYQFGKGGLKVDAQQALDHYLQAIHDDPDFFKPLYSAGFIYYERGDLGNARKYLGMAISAARGKSAADEAMASTAYGGCYLKEGKHREAEKWLRAAVRLNPTLPEAHVNLINCYLAQDRVAEARRAITDARLQAPHPIYQKLEARIAGNEGWGLTTPEGLRALGIAAAVGLILVVVMRLRRRPV